MVGRIEPASNVVLLVRLGPDGRYAVHKPVAGERRLWDFPDGTLAGREVAAFLVSEAGGWDVVPRTVLRSGPYGTGSTQLWIGVPGTPLTSVAAVVPAAEVPDGWVASFSAQDEQERELTVIHESAADVRSLAVLDAVLNNSDRKGAHVARDDAGCLWGFDHGVTCHVDPKLRTVLWGFVGARIEPADSERLDRLLAAARVGGELRKSLSAHLTEPEVEALIGRARRLRHTGVMPGPAPGWPSVPWPPL